MWIRGRGDIEARDRCGARAWGESGDERLYGRLVETSRLHVRRSESVPLGSAAKCYPKI